MDSIDFKITLKHLYQPGYRDFSFADVPAMSFLMVDGRGRPFAPDYTIALDWLYGVSHAIRTAARALDIHYVVPPLEGLWWPDTPDAGIAVDKHDWHWTMMIMLPDFIDPAMLPPAIAATAEKLASPMPASFRLEPFHEGLSLQIMHLGSHDEEGPALEHLHEIEIPGRKLVPNGHHHEIYLNDPRRTATDKLKTILRQPVRMS